MEIGVGAGSPFPGCLVFFLVSENYFLPIWSMPMLDFSGFVAALGPRVVRLMCFTRVALW